MEEIMYYKIYQSLLGNIILTSDGEYLTGLMFENGDVIKSIKNTLIYKDLPIFNETSRWLDGYFNGDVPSFTPKYRLNNLSSFRKRVLDITLEIPYGQTITYNEIAKRIAEERKIPKMSAQAVGGALHVNPIYIIIPCHRVIGANNALTGYGGGIENEIKLLEIEKNDMSKYSYHKKIK